MSIRVEGLESILDSLDNLTDTTGLAQSMGRACALVERSAKIKAPKDNGTLRNSITSKVEVAPEGVRGVVFTPLEYAPYVEFGTGLYAEEGGRKDVPWHYQDDEGNWHSTNGQHPQPFMRPALYENREEIKRIISGGMTDND